jgi:CheY-like chemotaxis protein
MKKILIVDNYEEIRNLLHAELAEKGLKVNAVSNGMEAEAYLKENQVDLVITAYLMPHMNGAELIASINNQFPLLPIVLLSMIYPLLPAFSYLSKAQVGDITYLSWPGESSTQLGFDLQALARAQGIIDPIVLGLTNDYMTYFTTQEEFHEHRYDSCSSFYGWKGGKRILEAHKKWLTPRQKPLPLLESTAASHR